MLIFSFGLLQETGQVFAFIDFEEASGVQNAIKVGFALIQHLDIVLTELQFQPECRDRSSDILFFLSFYLRQASPIQFKGRQIYVEGRKSNISSSHGPSKRLFLPTTFFLVKLC